MLSRLSKICFIVLITCTVVVKSYVMTLSNQQLTAENLSRAAHFENLMLRVEPLMQELISLCDKKETMDPHPFRNKAKSICLSIKQCFSETYDNLYPRCLIVLVGHIATEFYSDITDALNFLQKYDLKDLSKELSLAYRLRVIRDYWYTFTDHYGKQHAMPQKARRQTVWDHLYTDGMEKTRRRIYGTANL